MIKEIVIDNVYVHLWEGPTTPPITDHWERSQRRHPHRQAEFDLICALIPDPWTWDDIVKDNLGKPFLKNPSHHIGISHSNGFGCFAWSKDPFGIDIQTPHSSIFKVQHKYCNDFELDFLSNKEEDSRYLTIWSAKEAIYKFYGQGVDFKQDLRVSPFSNGDKKIVVECSTDSNNCTTFIVDCIQQSQYLITIAKLH